MSMRPDDHRRKWDKAEFQRKAQERLNQAANGDKNDEGSYLPYFFFRS